MYIKSRSNLLLKSYWFLLLYLNKFIYIYTKWHNQELSSILRLNGKLFFFNWRIIVLQCCSGLCCTSTLISVYIYIYIYIYISPLPLVPPSSPPHSTTPGHHSVPCVIEQLPTGYFTHDSVYKSMLFSQVSFPLLPLLCPSVHYLCLCLHFVSVNRFFSMIFLDSRYICVTIQ